MTGLNAQWSAAYWEPSCIVACVFSIYDSFNQLISQSLYHADEQLVDLCADVNVPYSSVDVVFQRWVEIDIVHTLSLTAFISILCRCWNILLVGNVVIIKVKLAKVFVVIQNVTLNVVLWRDGQFLTDSSVTSLLVIYLMLSLYLNSHIETTWNVMTVFQILVLEWVLYTWTSC